MVLKLKKPPLTNAQSVPNTPGVISQFALRVSAHKFVWVLNSLIFVEVFVKVNISSGQYIGAWILKSGFGSVLAVIGWTLAAFSAQGFFATIFIEKAFWY